MKTNQFQNQAMVNDIKAITNISEGILVVLIERMKLWGPLRNQDKTDNEQQTSYKRIDSFDHMSNLMFLRN